MKLNVYLDPETGQVVFTDVHQETAPLVRPLKYLGQTVAALADPDGRLIEEEPARATSEDRAWLDDQEGDPDGIT